MTYVYNQQSEDVLSSLAESSTETGHIGRNTIICIVPLLLPR